MVKGVFGWKKNSKFLNNKPSKKRKRGWDAYPTKKPITPVSTKEISMRDVPYYRMMQQRYNYLKPPPNKRKLVQLPKKYFAGKYLVGKPLQYYINSQPDWYPAQSKLKESPMVRHIMNMRHGLFEKKNYVGQYKLF